MRESTPCERDPHRTWSQLSHMQLLSLLSSPVMDIFSTILVLPFAFSASHHIPILILFPTCNHLHRSDGTARFTPRSQRRAPRLLRHSPPRQAANQVPSRLRIRITGIRDLEIAFVAPAPPRPPPPRLLPRPDEPGKDNASASVLAPGNAKTSDNDIAPTALLPPPP